MENQKQQDQNEKIAQEKNNQNDNNDKDSQINPDHSDSDSDNQDAPEEGGGLEKKIQENGQNKLSKKQLKKLEKRQKWEKIKREKRKQQREKQKQKRKLKRQQMHQQKKQSVPEHEGVENLPHEKENSKKRKQQYIQKMLDGQKVVIDLQFYDLMTEKEKTSLGKQLAYCHSVNRKVQKCFNFILTSATQERMKLLNEKYNVNNFGISIQEQDILSVFNKEKIVYLTGDADEELVQFDPEQVYIIGGIVDHNRLKNITIDYANQNGILARRLPMEGLKLKASVHLAVNHVWEWMLRYYNGATWKEAIKAVIPERKLQQTQIIS